MLWHEKKWPEIENLSKGYQRRVGIAQALIHDPDVLILDEVLAVGDAALQRHRPVRLPLRQGPS